MRIPLSWLDDFVDVGDDIGELTATLDDLGLVVEGVDRIGEGLQSVVVARVDEIRAIKGADRIRLVVADAGNGPVEVVCGAMNFDVGAHVPFAPVGAVLPGDFEITQRTMRGVVSNGMLCSGRELGLGDDHAGLLLLDELASPGELRPGRSLIDLLGVEADVVLDISPEGNRPDAWSVEGVARDIAARTGRELRSVPLATSDDAESAEHYATAAIDAPELCGALAVGVVRNVVVSPSPAWVRRRLELAGMRAVNNVVDASNYVMLELGQPTHPYDASLVAGRTIAVRRARPGEQLTTLDGVERVLGEPGRGLGDTGVDCVIVDGDDRVVGLAGIMGGASSEISASTRDVLVEAAFFDPMTIARTSKRLGLRSEASKRFERGVDPTLAPRALDRFVHILRESSPELIYAPNSVTANGEVPVRPVISVTAEQIERLLGTAISLEEAATLLSGLGFAHEIDGAQLRVTAPPARLDVRDGVRGRADVIEEIARLYGYRRLNRRTPTWVEPGSLAPRQMLRRRVRDALVGLGLLEAWTASMISDDEFTLMADGPLRVRVSNPLVGEESVLRPSMLTGLARAWGRNVERGYGDVALFEVGTVVSHPGDVEVPRSVRGGDAGVTKVELPTEHERILVLLGREGDDARTAVATWSALAERLGLLDVVVRSASAPKGWHPTRAGELVDRASGAVLGRVGELDPQYVQLLAPAAREGRRAGLVEIDFDVLATPGLVARRPETVSVPSRYPSASVDLAFVTPDAVNAADLAHAIRVADDLVESVTLFDVFRGAALEPTTRSLAYAVRLCASDRTLSDSEITAVRQRLIDAASSLGARLR